MNGFVRMKLQIFVLAAEIPCEWKFATKFASDCECDGVVHSGTAMPNSDTTGSDISVDGNCQKPTFLLRVLVA